MDQVLKINSARVQRYVENARKNSTEMTERLEKIGMDGLPAFEMNVQIWIKPLLDEIDLFEPAFFKIEAGYINFCQVFNWKGAEGMIYSPGWGYPWNTRAGVPSSLLKFHVPTSLKELYAIKLPSASTDTGNGSYNIEALPIDEGVLDKELVIVARELEEMQKHRKIIAEKARIEMLKVIEDGFDQLDDIASVQEYLAQICVSNPDEITRWTAAARRRSLAITAEKQKKDEAEAFAKKTEDERNCLAQEAEQLFRPFCIFVLKVAVKLPDDDNPHFSVAYVTASVPGEDGWYMRVDHGNVYPYRPECLVDVSRIEIDSPDHPMAPDICEHRELISQELPYLTERALVTPAVLF